MHDLLCHQQQRGRIIGVRRPYEAVAARTVRPSNSNEPSGQATVSVGAGMLLFRSFIFAAVSVEAMIRTRSTPATLAASRSSGAPIMWSAWLWEYTIAVTGKLVTSAIARSKLFALTLGGIQHQHPLVPHIEGGGVEAAAEEVGALASAAAGSKGW